ncbi:hypothetical protein PPYR_01404 [Photinus pyralis]|uniref:HECT domain-containing protein n=1 Tax=Photinus pyralis TaxID=7054 RepID=A0A5N4B4F7_PHOPY|nr:hypothetical protein PPYR_01404 [Photinus pyralis]
MVREIRGGGCRTITAHKTSTKKELLEEALNLFFPNGVSKFGSLNKFTYDLLDYQENAIEEKLTVGHMYNSSKLTSPRFYLVTNSLNSDTAEASTEMNCIDLDHDASQSIRKNVRKRSRSKAIENEDACSTSKSSNILDEFLSFDPETGGEPQSHFGTMEELEQLLQSNPESPSDSVQDATKVLVDVDELLFQKDFETAINNSLGIHQVEQRPMWTGTENTCSSLKEILMELNSKINTEKISKFNIYRADIFNCCNRALRRKMFSPFNKISVLFSDIEGNSEGAVDAGGPMREMFRLVIGYIQNSRMFFGEEKKYLTLDGEALQKEHYFEVGRLLALTLIHGGPTPSFSSKSLYSAVVGDGFSETDITLNDVESEIREKILKVDVINDFLALQKYVDDEAVFAIAGWPIIRKMEDKLAMLKDI